MFNIPRKEVAVRYRSKSENGFCHITLYFS
jgi:hypothetical protein